MNIETTDTIKTLGNKADTLQRQLTMLQRRLADEKESIPREQEHIDKLKASAGERVAEGDGEYLKLKTALKRREAALTASQEAVRLLERELIPNKAQELAGVRQKLTTELLELLLVKRKDVENAMAEHFDRLVAERDGFIEAAKSLFETFGLSVNRSTIIPAIRNKRLGRAELRRHTDATCSFVIPDAPQVAQPNPPAPVQDAPKTRQDAPGWIIPPTMDTRQAFAETQSII